MRKLLAALILALVLVPAGTAKADWEAGAYMTGESVVPPVRTTGYGGMYFYIPRDQSYIYYYLGWADLQGRPTGASIHVGAEGMNGRVMFNLGEIRGGTEGEIGGFLTRKDFVPGGVRTYEDAVAAILRGRAYGVLRSSLYPRGEIRGQIAVAE